MLLGIRVVDAEGHPVALKGSVSRNLPVGVVTLLMVIPFWGWILAVLTGTLIGLIELSLIARARGRQRLGDVLAGTFVIRETKK
jgi:uncharacterized RDD family membrane protein YckC